MITVNWTNKSTKETKQINLDSTDLRILSKKLKMGVVYIKNDLKQGKTVDTGFHTYKIVK